MGLCKCRNITDLFCFVHRKAVCQNCVQQDHATCVIGTYVEWLQDPDYEPPSCAICKDAITEDNVLRLMCLHLFHPECIDVHASSFPPNTAQAGFTCPTCSKPIIPPPSNHSDLARAIQQHLQQAPWLHPAHEPVHAPTNDHHNNTHNNTTAAVPEVTIDLPIGVEASGMSSRKKKAPNDLEGGDFFDDDDDKYRKQSVGHMLQGLLGDEGTSGGKKKPIRFTARQMLLLLGFLSILCTIIYLFRSLSTMP
eukprot:TRINITY_DN3808_c4_g1_i1.p1 TRINITY_DN3808_c4_g1~~TRINITY_DN3808_c4_g1_i1.p1  ORF type:complete len:251 (+),score=34.69 TRINITY_DN3808_c4_g1_i1:134-886(+)